MKTGDINIYNLGYKLKALRTKKGLSLQKLSKLVGIPQSSLSCYELNSQTPSSTVIYDLALFYNVSADFLLGIDKTFAMDYSNIFENIISLDNIDTEDRKVIIDLVKHFESRSVVCKNKK